MNNGNIDRLASVIPLAATLAVATPANATTIGFGATPVGSAAPGYTYVESGYRFVVTSGSQWAFYPNGNPGKALAAGITDTIGLGDTITITRVDGGEFKFAQLDYAAYANVSSDGLSFVGYLDNVAVDSLTNLTSSSTIYTVAFDPGMDTAIDELRIVGASQGAATLFLDNLVFSQVATPAPASAALLPVALAGLAFVRRRRG